MTQANKFPEPQDPEKVAAQLEADMYFYRAEHGFDSTYRDMKVVQELRDRCLGGAACTGAQEEAEHMAQAA